MTSFFAFHLYFLKVQDFFKSWVEVSWAEQGQLPCSRSQLCSAQSMSAHVLNLHSQPWANSHLWITTTCQQRPSFQRPNYNFYNISYLWTRTTCQQQSQFLGPKGYFPVLSDPSVKRPLFSGWPLYTGLTVYIKGNTQLWKGSWSRNCNCNRSHIWRGWGGRERSRRVGRQAGRQTDRCKVRLGAH